MCTIQLQARHTRQVGQSSLSADKGGAADGCARGGRGADGGAHSAGAEESGGHCVVCYGGVWVKQGVVALQWQEQRSASKCTEEAPNLQARPSDVIRIASHRSQHRNTDHHALQRRTVDDRTSIHWRETSGSH